MKNQKEKKPQINKNGCCCEGRVERSFKLTIIDL